MQLGLSVLVSAKTVQAPVTEAGRSADSVALAAFAPLGFGPVFTDESVDHLIGLVFLTVLCACLPILDDRQYLGLTGHSKFINLLNRHIIGWPNWNTMIEQHIIRLL
jgi:hypothetical protein